MKYDVTIVGGGMVGLAMAAALAGTNSNPQLRILLLEKRNLDQSLDASWLDSKPVDDSQFDEE